MGLADDRHGAEAVTRTGKVYTFDSIECLARFLDSEGADQPVHSVWVTDFADFPNLIPAESAHYLVSETLPSPMGMGLTAFGRMADRDGAVNSFGGDALDWEQVRTLVRDAAPMGPGNHGGHSVAVTPPGDESDHSAH
jgi:copper chaperone NosL